MLFRSVKSDDVTGRVRTYEAIVKGNNIPEPGVPESFKVLVKELQALGLDVRVLDKEGEEIQLSTLCNDEEQVPAFISRADLAAIDEELGQGGLEQDDLDDMMVEDTEDSIFFPEENDESYDDDEM